MSKYEAVYAVSQALQPICPLYYSYYSIGRMGEADMGVSEGVIKIIENAEHVFIPVSEKSNIYADLGFDSLSFVQLLLKIEEAYSVTFEIEEMELCLQVGRLIALVQRKRGGTKDD